MNTVWFNVCTDDGALLVVEQEGKHLVGPGVAARVDLERVQKLVGLFLRELVTELDEHLLKVIGENDSSGVGGKLTHEVAVDRLDRLLEDSLGDKRVVHRVQHNHKLGEITGAPSACLLPHVVHILRRLLDSVRRQLVRQIALCDRVCSSRNVVEQLLVLFDRLRRQRILLRHCVSPYGVGVGLRGWCWRGGGGVGGGDGVGGREREGERDGREGGMEGREGEKKIL